MPERDDADVLRMVVIFLRSYIGKTQAKFGRDSRIAKADVSRYELGKLVPSEKTLGRMAKAAGVPWSEVMFLRYAYGAIFARLAPWMETPFDGETPFFDREALERSFVAAAPHYLALTAPEPEPEPTPEEDQREAEEMWEALQRFPAGQRRRLVELSPPSSRNRALAALVAAASPRASGTEETSDLAKLAALIAEKIPASPKLP